MTVTTKTLFEPEFTTREVFLTALTKKNGFVRVGNGKIKKGTTPHIILEHFLLDFELNTHFTVTDISEKLCIIVYKKEVGISTIRISLNKLVECLPEKLVKVNGFNKKGKKGKTKTEFYLEEKIEKGGGE